MDDSSLFVAIFYSILFYYYFLFFFIIISCSQVEVDEFVWDGGGGEDPQVREQQGQQRRVRVVNLWVAKHLKEIILKLYINSHKCN